MMLTKSGLEIMNVLWQAGRPLSRNEIIDFSSRKSWKDGSIHTLLNGLLKKEAIREDGHVKCGKTYGCLFAPNINCEDYYAEGGYSIPGDTTDDSFIFCQNGECMLYINGYVACKLNESPYNQMDFYRAKE